ncbi:ATP-dependent RNA helicase mtr4, partial [Bonamia ostreae]
GRVACDISISDEFLTPELLLTWCFNDLNVEQIVSLASCLTGGDRAEVKVRLKNELADPYFRLQKAAKHVATTIRDAKIEIDFDQYVNSFRPNLMEVAYAWCKGAKFAQICKMTNSFEGAVIRVIRRLGELLEELSNASKIIGNEELAAKFEKGSKLIKRDIIF